MSIEKRPDPDAMKEIRRKIGKYEIKSLLGEGATGLVYEGYDSDIERRVAIKTLHSHLTVGKLGAGLLERFKREAISAAKCLHPNVVTILEYGQHENKPFIVMEYVDGVSVHQLIRHRRKHGRGISLRRSLSIVSGLLAALHAAHSFGIVHRDVKASNVLIARGNYRIKLADFGMARIKEDSDLTMIGSLIGTPRYMAPEVRFGLEADARADVFSATRLFLELLRMLPNSSRYTRSRLPEIVAMPPGNRIDYSTVYPAAFIPVLLKGLAVDRTRRHQSVADLMRAIKDALPNLQKESAIAPVHTAPVAQESNDYFPASADELGTMTSLLADYVGPAATSIMEEHETKSTSADNLAAEISREIPERKQQDEFLRRWQLMSLSRRELIDRTEPQVFPDKGRSQPLTEAVLDKISTEFAHFIEPISKTLFRQSSARTRDVD